MTTTQPSLAAEPAAGQTPALGERTQRELLSELQSAETLLLAAADGRTLVLRRAFGASPAAVFAALTRPELLRRWYGPPGWTLERCEVDLRVGGRYHFAARGPAGVAMVARGVYRAVAPGARLVHTEVLAPAWYAGASLVTTTLAPAGARTVLTTAVRFPSPAARASAGTAQMLRGAEASFSRLAAALAALTPARRAPQFA